jgi:hypothetical protein
MSRLGQGELNLKRSPTETLRIKAPNYIRERSAGEIIRESLRIYDRHCRIILLIYVPVTVLAKFMANVLQDNNNALPGVWWTATIIRWVIPYSAGLVLTVAISFIYLGYDLKLSRIFGRSIPLLGKALITALLITILLVLYPWLLFAIPVVMIEGLWGFKALQRSWELGKYYRLRNFFIYVWPFTLYIGVYMAIQLVFLYLNLTNPRFKSWEIAFLAVQDLIFSLIAPLLIIVAVLLYYDMRIRNEGYDIASLAEDLRI